MLNLLSGEVNKVFRVGLNKKPDGDFLFKAIEKRGNEYG